VAGQGARLSDRLRALRKEFPFVGDVRGAGYMWGLEFVADPVTAAPPDPALDVTAKAVAAAAASRLIVYPARFCVDGTQGDAILIGPPLTATDEELEELGRRLLLCLGQLGVVGADGAGHDQRVDVAQVGRVVTDLDQRTAGAQCRHGTRVARVASGHLETPAQHDARDAAHAGAADADEVDPAQLAQLHRRRQIW